MTAARNTQWSVGAAGPVLRLAAAGESRDATWKDFALCAEVDPEMFFPEVGGMPFDVKAVCRRCRVRPQCLEAGLEERHGIWGGQSVEERAVERRLRGLPALPPLPPLDDGKAGLDTKRCVGVCGLDLALSEFNLDSAYRDGHASRCRSCDAIYRAGLRKRSAA